MEKMNFEISQQKVILEFNLPEFSRKDIEVKVSKNLVKVYAKKELKEKIHKQDFEFSGESSKIFSYSTTVPDINSDKVDMVFNEGILRIKLERV